MKKEFVIFIIGFIIGVLWGSSIVNWLYYKVAEIKASVVGDNIIIVNKDYITLKKVGNDLYVYIDIEKPVKAVLYIPMNETPVDYYYNISKEMDINVNGDENELNILINHKLEVVP